MRSMLRAAVTVLLAMSGVLSAAAAAQRWWPACPWGDFDGPACVPVQDHAYDYLLPSAPWTPIGDAAQLAGLALTCLAVAVAVLPWLWLPRRVGASMAVAVPALAAGVVGVPTWTAGRAGEPSTLPGGPATVLLWIVGVPGALLVAAAPRSRRTPPGTGRWRVLVVLLLTMATPVAALLVGPLLVGYLSHDSAPWTEVVTAGSLMAASVGAWLSTRARSSAPARTDRSVPDEALSG